MSDLPEGDTLSLPKGWVINDLGGVVELVGGGTPKTSIPNYWNGEIPWLSVVDFNDDNRWVMDTGKSITEHGLNNSSTKLLNKGDLIISARGTVGALAQLKKTMAFNQSCYGIKEKYDISDANFLYYLIKYSLIKISRNVHGAVFDTITRQTFDNIFINLPPLQEQKSIAKLLSSFDEKIELLREQNETLETLAQTIFKEWFVNFNYPDATGEMVVSEFGEIPKGWRIGSLLDIFELIGGGTPKTTNKEYWGGNIPWYSVVDAPNGSNSFVINTEKNISEMGLKNSSTKLLRKGTTIVSARGSVGKLAIVGQEMAMNQSCYGIIGKGGCGDYYVHFQVKGILKTLKNNVHGAVFDTITTSTFASIKIPIPLTLELNDFEASITPIMEKILNNVYQIQTLTKTRDTLLPKLMSGEVRVN